MSAGRSCTFKCNYYRWTGLLSALFSFLCLRPSERSHSGHAMCVAVLASDISGAVSTHANMLREHVNLTSYCCVGIVLLPQKAVM